MLCQTWSSNATNNQVIENYVGELRVLATP
jgi:hypothetical protein